VPSDPCLRNPSTADPTNVAKTKIPKQVCCRETAVMRSLGEEEQEVFFSPSDVVFHKQNFLHMNVLKKKAMQVGQLQLLATNGWKEEQVPNCC